VRWEGHVARLGKRRVYTGFLCGKPEGNNHLEDPGVDGMMILEWIFRNWEGGMDWIDLTQYRDRWRALAIAVLNLGGSIKCREFLD